MLPFAMSSRARRSCRRSIRCGAASCIERPSRPQSSCWAQAEASWRRLCTMPRAAATRERSIKYGVMAAEAAASLGAHRQAAAQYQRVLRFADGRPAAERASFLQHYAEECATIDNLDEAIKAYQQAVQLWREMQDLLKEGETLAALAWPLVRSGQNAAAEQASDQAMAVLETLPPTKQLASAYRVKAHLRMLDRDRGLPSNGAGRRSSLPRSFQDHAVVAGAEMVVGSAMLVTGDDRGRPHLDRCLALARENGLDSLVALAYLNIGSSYGEQYRFAEADRELAEGIAFARSRDLDHACHYMCAWLALTRLYQGALGRGRRPCRRGHCRAEPCRRQQDHGACGSRPCTGEAGRSRAQLQALDEALELASRTETLQRLAPVRAARAELAWLARRPRAGRDRGPCGL